MQLPQRTGTPEARLAADDPDRGGKLARFAPGLMDLPDAACPARMARDLTMLKLKTVQRVATS